MIQSSVTPQKIKIFTEKELPCIQIIDTIPGFPVYKESIEEIISMKSFSNNSFRGKMERFEKKQEFIKGALAGLVASIVMFVFVEFFHWLGLTKFGISALAGDTVFTYKDNLEMNIIAFFIHCCIGVFWGVIISFLFTKVFSTDFYPLKIIFISFYIFFFHSGFLDDVFHYKREFHKQTFDLLIILSGYILYGFILAIGLKRQGIIDD